MIDKIKNMSNTKFSLIIIVCMILVLIIGITISYSYLAVKMNNLETASTIFVDTGKMTITYNDPSTNFSPDITLSNILPGVHIVKKFTLTGENTTNNYSQEVDSNMYYKVGLVIDSNTFSEGALKYELTKDDASDSNGKMIDTISGNIPQEGTLWLGGGYFSSDGNKSNHIYNLKIDFPETGEDQSINQGKQFAAHVTISDEVKFVSIDIVLDNLNENLNYNRFSLKNTEIILEQPSREGYNFVGWNILEGDAVIDGNKLTLNNSESVKIEAMWNLLIPPAGTFANDSWETIAYYASHPENDSTPYNVGDTREISLSGFINGEANSGGKYTLRVANNSNYNCTLESKTACGFVVEFADIITTHRMNATQTNVGGWPNSELYDYVKTDIYNALPSELRAVIVDTTVVSGHGSTSGETNFTSTDKLYLLSTREVYRDCTVGTNNGGGCYDYGSSYTVTRQLDYYASKGVVTSDSSKYKEAIKQLDGISTWWWLRSAHSNTDIYFNYVYNNGSNYYSLAGSGYGVAPAFRIG